LCNPIPLFHLQHFVVVVVAAAAVVAAVAVADTPCPVGVHILAVDVHIVEEGHYCHSTKAEHCPCKELVAVDSTGQVVGLPEADGVLIHNRMAALGAKVEEPSLCLMAAAVVLHLEEGGVEVAGVHPWEEEGARQEVEASW
jgi:hypothetical protein